MLCWVEFAERASYYGVQTIFSNFMQYPLPPGGNGAGAPPRGTQETAGALGKGEQFSVAIGLLFTQVLPILLSTDSRLTNVALQLPRLCHSDLQRLACRLQTWTLQDHPLRRLNLRCRARDHDWQCCPFPPACWQCRRAVYDFVVLVGLWCR